MSEFVTKDSGERQVFASGMHRDTTKGKQRPDLVVGDGPMFDRWVALMTRGAEKYDARNWMRASGEDELQRFRESALRHFVQWYTGDTDEDHAAATFFNINGAEYVKGRTAEAVKAFEDFKSPVEASTVGLKTGKAEPVMSVPTTPHQPWDRCANCNCSAAVHSLYSPDHQFVPEAVERHPEPVMVWEHFHHEHGWAYCSGSLIGGCSFNQEEAARVALGVYKESFRQVPL